MTLSYPAGWDPTSPAAWSQALGLTSYPLFEPGSLSGLPGGYAVLLDGASGSFLLAIGPVADRAGVDTLLSWAGPLMCSTSCSWILNGTRSSSCVGMPPA